MIVYLKSAIDMYRYLINELDFFFNLKYSEKSYDQ